MPIMDKSPILMEMNKCSYDVINIINCYVKASLKP